MSIAGNSILEASLDEKDEVLRTLLTTMTRLERERLSRACLDVCTTILQVNRAQALTADDLILGKVSRVT